METWKTVLITILSIIIVMMSIYFVGELINSPETPMEVSNLEVNYTGLGMYNITGNLIPNKDFDYIGMVVVFYDKNGAVIEKCPLAWNINNVNKGQSYQINGMVYISGDRSPAKVKVFFFDTPFEADESKAIYVSEGICTNDNSEQKTESSEPVYSTPQKTAYAYKSDGTPMYSQSEVDNYMMNKYGDVDYHLNDNGYVNLDEEGYDDAGNRIK